MKRGDTVYYAYSRYVKTCLVVNTSDEFIYAVVEDNSTVSQIRKEDIFSDKEAALLSVKPTRIEEIKKSIVWCKSQIKSNQEYLDKLETELKGL